MRSTCWFARGGCTCDYTYGDAARRLVLSSDIGYGATRRSLRPSGKARVSLTRKSSSGSFADCMERLTELVFSRLTPKLGPEDWPNSANLNYYADGTQSVGWHSDDESLFQGKVQDCSIVSLSLGGRREFWIALKTEGAEPSQESVVEVDLRHGDLLSMEGLMQKHTLHFLTREPRQRADFWPPRINITWRWIVNHRRGCPLRGQPCSYPKCLEKGPLDASGEASPRVATWWPADTDESRLDWRLCTECRHPGWHGGRRCLRGEGRFSDRWFCRPCWRAFCGEEAERDPTERAAEAMQMRLVNKVKLMQKRKDLKKSWESFCEAESGLRDPARHAPTSLLSWLETIDAVPEDLQPLLAKARTQLQEAVGLVPEAKEHLVAQGEVHLPKMRKPLRKGSRSHGGRKP
ncbi:Alkbh3, partial [Symbiodinium natans]